MAVFGIHFQHISKLNRIAYRLTSFSTTACASSYRSFGSSPMVGSTAPQAAVQHLEHVRVQDPNGNMSRFLTSANTKENMKIAASLIDEDYKRIRQKGIDLLREHIVNDEMYKIASYYQRESSSFVWVSLYILLAKAINYHKYNNGTLTHKQDTTINLIEIAIMSYLLHDDIADNAKIRFNIPAAHVVWNPYQVVVAGNMMLAVSVNEAAKLSQDVLVNMCQAHERQFKGQCMQEKSHLPNDDRLGYHFSVLEHMSASPAGYWCRAIAQISGASDLLIDIVTKLGYNNYMFLQLVDDIKDMRMDLESGLHTATVILASKEHPIIEDMMLRKFEKEGDVEKAVELVNNSNGKEEAKILAKRYYNYVMQNLVSLSDSPYRAGLETVVRIQYERKINSNCGKKE